MNIYINYMCLISRFLMASVYGKDIMKSDMLSKAHSSSLFPNFSFPSVSPRNTLQPGRKQGNSGWHPSLLIPHPSSTDGPCSPGVLPRSKEALGKWAAIRGGWWAALRSSCVWWRFLSVPEGLVWGGGRVLGEIAKKNKSQMTPARPRLP